MNRLLYGLRDEPYVVLAGLGQRLKTTLDPDAVLSTIVETVKEALKLSFVAIEVKEGTSFVQAASSGTPPVKEALRLRRDLHDGLGPMLSAIMLNVGLVRTIFRRDPETTDTLLNQLEEEIELVIGDIRRVVYNLRPPALDELGLAGAIREYVARFRSEEQVNNVALKVTVDAPESLPPLPAAVEVAAYRIVQEAVTNVIRHAHAHSCCVCFQVQDALQIEVSDDGKGIEEADRSGVGLTSMRERAEELGGSFTIKKTSPCGTQIMACLPLAVETKAGAHL